MVKKILRIIVSLVGVTIGAAFYIYLERIVPQYAPESLVLKRVFDSCIVKKSLKPLERLYFFVKFHISILSTFEPCVII